jgi:hypothetical protein
MDKGCEQRPEKSKSHKTHSERIDGNSKMSLHAPSRSRLVA